MEKKIKIGDKEVRLKAAGGTGVRYRNQFNRDYLDDLMLLTKFIEERKQNPEAPVGEALKVIEQIAWAMAKTADDNIPELAIWLDNFGMFDLINSLSDIMELTNDDLEMITAKKKTVIEAEEKTV